MASGLRRSVSEPSESDPRAERRERALNPSPARLTYSSHTEDDRPGGVLTILNGPGCVGCRVRPVWSATPTATRIWASTSNETTCAVSEPNRSHLNPIAQSKAKHGKAADLKNESIDHSCELQQVRGSGLMLRQLGVRTLAAGGENRLNFKPRLQRRGEGPKRKLNTRKIFQQF